MSNYRAPDMVTGFDGVTFYDNTMSMLSFKPMWSKSGNSCKSMVSIAPSLYADSNAEPARGGRTYAHKDARNVSLHHEEVIRLQRAFEEYTKSGVIQQMFVRENIPNKEDVLINKRLAIYTESGMLIFCIDEVRIRDNHTELAYFHALKQADPSHLLSVEAIIDFFRASRLFLYSGMIDFIARMGVRFQKGFGDRDDQYPSNQGPGGGCYPNHGGGYLRHGGSPNQGQGGGYPQQSGGFMEAHAGGGGGYPQQDYQRPPTVMRNPGSSGSGGNQQFDGNRQSFSGPPNPGNMGNTPISPEKIFG